MKKILLIGRGHLGQYLKKLWNVPEELYWQGDLADITSSVLKKLLPEFVVNCAGKTDLPWCEQNALEAFRCNAVAPLACYRAAVESKIPFIHVSSGCVWDGPYRSDGRPFTTSDKPTPACFYSWTKVCGDALIMSEAASPYLILRPRQVYSPCHSNRNLLSKLCSYENLLDTPNSMTSADTIAKTIELAVESQLAWNRMLLVYDLGVSSPYKVGTLLANAGLRKQPNLLEKKDLDKWHKPRRVDTVLFDPYFESVVQPPKVEDELVRVINLYKNDN